MMCASRLYFVGNVGKDVEVVKHRKVVTDWSAAYRLLNTGHIKLVTFHAKFMM